MKKGSFKITDSSKPENTNYKSLILRLSAVLLTVAILATILIGLPEGPLSLIVGSRKVSAVRQQQLLLPTDKLSQSVSVNACSKERVSTVYESAENFKMLSSGIRVFRARVSKEYKQGQNSLSLLAQDVLNNSRILSSQTKTCLLPLRIRADVSLGKEIPAAKLLEVSVGSESVICSEGQAYLSPDAKNSKLYPVSQSLESYARSLKAKQVVLELKRRLAKLQDSRARNKADALKRDQKIRELSLSVTYAEYFSKDALKLGSFFDALCKQTAAIATPAAKTTVVPTKGVSPVATATASPQFTATRIPTITPTLVVNPSGYDSTTSWTNIAVANQSGSFRISFKVVPLANNIDGVTGFSDGAATGYDSLGPIVRFNTSGAIDARNGGSYAALSQLSYTAGKEYLVSMDIHLHNRTYSVSVRNDAGQSYEIASGYAFRASQAAVSQLNNIGIYSSTGSHRISHISAALAIGTPTPMPTVTPTPTVQPGACGSIPNGGTTTRTRYSTTSVPAGQTCPSESQTGTCNNGLISWTGSAAFIHDYCAPETPDDINLCASGSAGAISRHGITWTFDHAYTCGRYANGDYWVLGPVKINDINPRPTDSANGSMLNPGIGPNHGFDNGAMYSSSYYKPELNVGKNISANSPLILAVNSSLVSSITLENYNNYPVEMYSILTVVENPPAGGSFRPSAIGNGSRASLWRESDLDYSKLNTLPKSSISSLPDIDQVARNFSYPWFEINQDWTGGYIRTPYMAHSDSPHYHGYGRDMAYRTGDAALLLNLDYTPQQKRNLLIGYVQAGIDNYGFITKGGVWYNDGGHNLGRLAPVIVAAGVLKDNRLKAVINGAAQKFQELQSTFIITQSDTTRQLGQWQDCDGNAANGRESLRSTNCGIIIPYKAEDVGRGEWGIRHTGNPELDNNWWMTDYRTINGSNFTAPTMAARVMGLRDTINWEALFKYAEYYITNEPINGSASNPTPAFHVQFYNAFKNATPVP